MDTSAPLHFITAGDSKPRKLNVERMWLLIQRSCVQVHTQQQEKPRRIPNAFNRNEEPKLKALLSRFYQG